MKVGLFIRLYYKSTHSSNCTSRQRTECKNQVSILVLLSLNDTATEHSRHPVCQETYIEQGLHTPSRHPRGTVRTVKMLGGTAYVLKRTRCSSENFPGLNLRKWKGWEAGKSSTSQSNSIRLLHLLYLKLWPCGWKIYHSCESTCKSQMVLAH